MNIVPRKDTKALVLSSPNTQNDVLPNSLKLSPQLPFKQAGRVYFSVCDHLP